MSNFYSILTNAGIQKEILAKKNGTSINLAKMAVGDGIITPTQNMTSLQSEKYRFNINSILQDATNPNYLVVEGVIPSSIGGFEISEIGIYLDDNTFYAVGNIPKTYKPTIDEGSAKDLTIKMIIEVSTADNIVLKVDDNVVLATRKFVQSELKKYAFLNGDETKLFKVKDAVALNEAVNKKQLESFSTGILNKSSAGYQVLPSGLILQWGFLPGKAGKRAINFPIAFPTIVLNKQISLAVTAGTETVDYSTIVSSSSLSTIEVFCSSDASVYYFVIGY